MNEQNTAITNPVWIVDDDRSIRWVLEKALARQNIPNRSFESADDAMGALAANDAQPAVVLTDVRMPGMDARPGRNYRSGAGNAGRISGHRPAVGLKHYRTY